MCIRDCNNYTSKIHIQTMTMTLAKRNLSVLTENVILMQSTLGQLSTSSSRQHFCCWKTAFRQRWLDEKCLLGMTHYI